MNKNDNSLRFDVLFDPDEGPRHEERFFAVHAIRLAAASGDQHVVLRD